MGNLSPHFDDQEFRCWHCGKLPKQGISKKLIEKLELLRCVFGQPITITRKGGYRCPVGNKLAGGARFSQHKKGAAADIIIEGVPAKKVQDAGDRIFTGMGRYAHFTHVDVRAWKARWSR